MGIAGRKQLFLDDHLVHAQEGVTQRATPQVENPDSIGSITMRHLCLIPMGIVIAMGLALPGWAGQDPGLVAHYTFEEGPGGVVKDWSGKGNHGKNKGAKYVDVTGGKGLALRFDTRDAVVDCGNRPSLDLTDALTVELWFYPELRPAKGEAGVVGKGYGSFLLSYPDGWFYVGTPSGRMDCSFGAPVKTWNHIVATFDGRYLRTYRDGKPVNVVEAGAETQKITSGGKLYLRQPVVWGGKVEPVFKCTMDDVRIYNRVLSGEEVSRHYRSEAKDKGKDVAWIEKVKLTPHVFAAASTVVVEADFSDMGPLLSPGCGLRFELRNKALDKVVASHEVSPLPKSRKLEFDWTLSAQDAPAGEYELRAVVRDKAGAQIGTPSSVDLKVAMEKPPTPDWVKAYDDVKVLNNLVAELLNVQTPQKEADKEYAFKNPRDGWVFLSVTAPAGGFDKMVLSIDPVPSGEEAAVYGIARGDTLEAMRQLPAGDYKLSVQCEGAGRPTAAIVRAIPELVYTGLGYDCGTRADKSCPWLKSYGPYTYEYIEKVGLIENLNVMLERAARPENVRGMKDWRKQGKKVLTASFISWLTRQAQPVTADAAFADWSKYGFQGPGYHGTLMSEFGGGPHHAKEYPAFTEAVKRLGAEPKFKGRVFYPYTSGMYAGELSRAFLQALIDAGYKWAEEPYLEERPSEEAAREYMNADLRRRMLRYQDAFPDSARHMIMNLGYMSIPHESLDNNPGVDYKVFLDMQMHLIANDPAYFGIYGVSWYHSAYADEEVMRWSAKLNRHYCIEGKRDRLTNDPYMLPHIKNGDFDDGLAGWELEPAEEESIAAGQALGYGHLQGRFRTQEEGNHFVVTRRSDKAPNRFSQQIRKLTPGRLYSLRMLITDYGDLMGRKSVEKSHDVSVAVDGVELLPEKSFREVLDGVELLPEKSFREVFGCMHSYGGLSRGNPLYMTYQRIVFRATSESAKLVISDWAIAPSTGSGQAAPGGPAGQQLAFNFIQIQPYLED